MEGGWVLVCPLSSRRSRGEAQAPTSARLSSLREHHHPRPFLHRGGRESLVLRPRSRGGLFGHGVVARGFAVVDDDDRDQGGERGGEGDEGSTQLGHGGRLILRLRPRRSLNLGKVAVPEPIICRAGPGASEKRASATVSRRFEPPVIPALRFAPAWDVCLRIPAPG